MTLTRSVVSLAALGTAALAATATGLSRSRAAAAETAYPPLGRFMTVEGRSLHYLQEGEGPDLVLLHGAGGNLREFKFDLMGRLSPRFRVTAFDRPGLGYSDAAPGVSDGAFSGTGSSPQQQAGVLIQAMEALGIVRPVMVGHSYGGIVGLALAVQALERPGRANPAALVNLAGVAMPWTTSLGAYYRVNGSALGGAVVTPLITAFATRRMVAERIASIFAPQPVPAGYADFVGAELNLRPRAFRNSIRQVNSLLPHVREMSGRYPELTLPVESLYGTEDSTVPLSIHGRPLAEVLPTVRLTVLPGVGHMPHHAEPETVIAAIDRAMARAAS